MKAFILLCFLALVTIAQAQCVPAYACGDDGPCPYGSHCCGRKGVDNIGTCQLPVPLSLGDACNATDLCFNCPNNAQCFNGICTQFTAGCACSATGGCGDQGNLFCLNGICAPTDSIGFGEACESTRQCRDGGYCAESGVCTGNTTYNIFCDYYGEYGQYSNCQAGLYCSGDPGICARYAGQAQDCSSNECEPGLYCDHSTNEDGDDVNSCLPVKATGEPCSSPGDCIGVCNLDTNLCADVNTLPIGTFCLDENYCINGSACLCLPLNGTNGPCGNTLCQSTSTVLAIGDFCHPYSDLCNGNNSVCRCIGFDDDDNCIEAKCIALNSLPDNSTCDRDIQCQGFCDSGRCFTFAATATNESCTTNNACAANARCDINYETGAGLCTDAISNITCTSKDNCANNQECACNGDGSSSCEATYESQFNYRATMQLYTQCVKLGDFNQFILRHPECIDALYSGEYAVAVPSQCQKTVASFYCCYGCLIKNLTREYTGATPQGSYDFGAPPYIYDCSTFTMTPRSSPGCCASTNGSCPVNDFNASFTNCYVTPSSTSSSTTSASRSASNSGSTSSNSGTNKSVSGSKSVSGTTGTTAPPTNAVSSASLISVFSALSIFVAILSA